MKTKFSPRAMWVTAIAIVAGAGVGTVVGITTTGTVTNVSAAENYGHQVTVESFETNSRGQTLGEFGVGLTHDPSAIPDLILVVGESGKEGYARYTDLFGATPATPDEASALSESSLKAKVLPVYDRDGSTVIDSYIANYGY